MAAPADVTIQNLSGVFSMDKANSTDPDAILQLQGISWIVRKAIQYATVTLHVTQYTETDPETSKPVVKIDISQVTTGGLSGTTEKRVMNWTEREHKDHIFGTVVGKSRFFRGSKGADGKVRPNVDVQTNVQDEKVRRFLRGEILADGTEVEGFLVEEPTGDDLGEGEGLWLQSFVRNVDSGWTAEQIWGFEIVNGERRYTRRIAVADKNGNYQLGRMVYSFQGRKEQ
ncbi:hypothetical protein VTN96DRAFT_9608 [Rasamsonia emersonii]|uniref:Uncharacterized protein n=1 Tax=Rasamsonia emersonii (strain ATCC 16479 / CBS 393.64 / IMI 116815) TaxID=1408163 RepID=A0A0F4YU64_RASE3|nr:hypothetical protein T310_4577 [Rasamsonia emersonii CBS 393.64]KKA21396.1 hypothetical protein T310_4577 [Rasamsonia emersonii CBS 393.64]